MNVHYNHPPWSNVETEYIFEFLIASTLSLTILVYTYYHIVRKYVHIEIIKESQKIMHRFAAEPIYDDFLKLYDNRELLINESGGIYKFWFYGIYLKYPTYFNEKQLNEISLWEIEIQRLIQNIPKKPTNYDTECIRYLYFATNDSSYLDKINQCLST